MCFDTAFTNPNDTEGFRQELLPNKRMGFDGKPIINPKQMARGARAGRARRAEGKSAR